MHALQTCDWPVMFPGLGSGSGMGSRLRQPRVSLEGWTLSHTDHWNTQGRRCSQLFPKTRQGLCTPEPRKPGETDDCGQQTPLPRRAQSMPVPDSTRHGSTDIQQQVTAPAVSGQQWGETARVPCAHPTHLLPRGASYL